MRDIFRSLITLAYTPKPIEVDEREVLRDLLDCWRCYARPDQLRPSACRKWWNLQAGRGFGKTRAGAEHTLDMMELWGDAFDGGACSKTADDVRSIMVEGRSGLIACARRRGTDLIYIPSKRLILHPNGAKLHLYSGEAKGDTRGFSGNYFWADELPHWQYAEEAFMNVDLALRERAPDPGPHGIITSTPLRRSIISSMLVDPERAHLFTTTRGKTAHNIENLSPGYVEAMVRQYGATWKGRQELEGELITDGAGGFSKELIDRHRDVSAINRDLREIVIAIDPAVTSKKESDATGIVIVGAGGHGDVTHFYVLDDMTHESATPRTWITAVLHRVVSEQSRYNVRVRCLIEDNQGGETWDLLFETVAQELRLPMPQLKRVTATRSKIERADQAGLLYEQGRVHHIGILAQLEEEMVRWVPGMDSPDRMDALVHVLNELAATWPSTGGDLTGRITGA